jgi:serine protease Do
MAHFKQVHRHISILLVAAAGIATGCAYFSQRAEDRPVAQLTPSTPLVIDGTRASYADVVERTSPAVVRIEASARARRQASPSMEDFFGLPRGQQRPQVERGVGSGVIVNADGTLLTNFHVVDGADKITILTSNNESHEAKIVGTDQPSDLAVLKIEGDNFPFLNLGNSDAVRVGDMVLAIGNPLGIGQTVTAGIISAKGRRTGLSDGQSFEDFLQTDAPINRGNSGGALVNLQGELIGINSQILSPGGAAGGNIGIAFAIPSNMAKSVMEQLLKDGRVRRGMLGVGIQNVTEETAKALELKERSGILVSNVTPGSAAEKAGIKRGDVITAVNGEKVEDSNVLRNRIAGTLPGTEVRLSIVRNGEQMELTATLDEFKVRDLQSSVVGPGNEKEGGSPSGKLGITVQPLTPQIARQLGIEDVSEGVVITDVDASGPAAEAGLSAGDVILEVNRRPVKSLQDVSSAIENSGDRPILLLITRRGQTVYLTVTP